MSLLLLAGCAASTGTLAWSAPGSTVPTVPCDERIAQTKFPYLGSKQPAFQYRTLLGAVSVPPAYMRQVFPTQMRSWPYFHKQGLVVRANGVTVSVSVPASWRDRVGISWGNTLGVVSALRIAGCGSQPGVGNAYAGGFYLRSRSACVPLTFRVGRRSATVRFGLGMHCT